MSHPLPIHNPLSVRLGVAGAGAMGSGIALTALSAGMFVTLYDVSEPVLDKARAYIDERLHRKKQESALGRLSLTTDLEEMSGAGVVIEAIPEVLQMKEQLFARLGELCPPPAVLATNTSTLPVTAIAAAAAHPQRVAGMHFFNPAPVMPLVELVRGAQTAPETIESLSALAALLGKTPVVARDTPGFIVNRVARPFYGEALRLLGEGAASHDIIDCIVRLAGGFKMGPFQLMDLIGIDVNFAATRSMYEQTFGEPRYRPHPIQAQMVQQRRLGRKTGQGFYRYDPGNEIRDPALPRAEAGAGAARPVVISPGSWAPGLADLCRSAGIFVTESSNVWAQAGVVAAGRDEGAQAYLAGLDNALEPSLPLFVQCAGVTLAEAATWTNHPERLVGVDGLFFANGPLATLVAGPGLVMKARQAAEALVASLGRVPVWVDDTPALVLPRIVAMLANEAAFAVGEGVAPADTVDTAMKLGTNYPRGPLEWAQQLGYAKIVAVLDHLHAEFHEDRYRAAPLLRRWARAGASL